MINYKFSPKVYHFGTYDRPICPGIFLNVDTESVTKKSGEYLSLTAYTARTYDVVPSWKWFKDGLPDTVLSSQHELIFPSIRVSWDLEMCVLHSNCKSAVDVEPVNFTASFFHLLSI